MVPPTHRTDTRRPGFRVATLSDSRRRALSILNESFPLTPTVFAHYMWPTSESWVRPNHVGRGICLKAGVFLVGLQRDGLARKCSDRYDAPIGYVLTDWGASATDTVPRSNRLS